MIINRCLIVDAETSGLDRETHGCTEPGAILYSLESAASLVEFSTLTAGVSTNPDAERLTGITQAMLDEMKTVRQIIERATGRCFLSDAIIELSQAADCVVSHNIEFDRQWPELAMRSLPWYCTLEDFQFPNIAPGQTLIATALALGVPVVSAHRALTDCRLLAAIFTRCRELGCDLQELFAVAQRPKALFVAHDGRRFFDLPETERNAMIAARKAAGFKWDRQVKGAWARRMPVEDTAALPFEVRIVGI